MKVFAINSSARTGGQSKTELILDHLTKGLEEAGAEVEVVNIHRRKIATCIGCFTCWTKTPGICVHRDDMTNELFPGYMASDLCIMATPLFHYTVNATMKRFIERTLPFAQPFFVKRDGVTRHPLRQEPPPVVAVSVAGFPEYSVFDPLSSYLRYLYQDRLNAEIYIPAAESMAKSSSNPKVKALLEAVVQAGRELAENQMVSEKTMAAINTPTLDFETMAPIGNIYWQTCIDEGVTPKEFDALGLVPRPDSLETFLSIMNAGFNADKASAFKACFQFDFTGEVEGSCYLEVSGGEITTGMGAAPKADVIIKSPFAVWMDITTKKADGQQLFLEQAYQVEGDLALLMKMGEMFGGA